MAKLSIPAELHAAIDLAGSDMNLINQLVAIRKSRGMTQQDVANIQNVDRSVVARLESTAGDHSKNHTMETLRRYAEAIGVFLGHQVFDLHDEREKKAAEEFRRKAQRQLRERRRKAEAPEKLPACESERVNEQVYKVTFPTEARRTVRNDFTRSASTHWNTSIQQSTTTTH